MSVRIRFGNAGPERPRLWPVPRVFDMALLRRSIEADIERQIAFLDTLDADPDLEPGGDAEPSLGWTSTMATGDTRDLEDDTPPP